MITCRFVGNDSSNIGDREFEAIGQKAELSEQGFREAILGGAAFIPESDFSKIGFTAEELAAHGPAGLRVDPPHAFVVKVEKAQQVFQDIRKRMTREGAGHNVLAEFSDNAAEVE